MNRSYFKRPNPYNIANRQSRRQPKSSSHQKNKSSSSWWWTSSTANPIKSVDPYVDLLNRFGSWGKVGTQYTQQIPSGQALPATELKQCTDKGITFIRILGAGGFGTVWKCRLSQPLSDRTGKTDYTQYEMAVKILSIDKFKRNRTPQQAVKQMMEEYDLHRSLDHENLVHSEDAFHVMDQTTQFPYVRHLHFMELCTNCLRSLLNQSELSESHAKQWFKQVSMGLQYLHNRGIAHMDIKTANILFKFHSTTNTTTYKLSDYGLSVTNNQIGYFAGTRTFAAPELFTATRAAPVDTFKCDIYSLGLTICETLIGKNRQSEAMAAIKKVKNPNQMLQITSRRASPKLPVKTYKFVNMVYWMLTDDPNLRPTIDQVINCQWFQESP